MEMRAAGVGSARCKATCGGSALGKGLTGSPRKQCGHVGGTSVALAWWLQRTSTLGQSTVLWGLCAC